MSGIYARQGYVDDAPRSSDGSDNHTFATVLVGDRLLVAVRAAILDREPHAAAEGATPEK